MGKNYKRWWLEQKEKRNKEKVNKYYKKWKKSEIGLEEFLDEQFEKNGEDWKKRNAQKKAINHRAIMYIMFCIILLLISMIISIYIEVKTNEIDPFLLIVIRQGLDAVNIVMSITAGIGVSTLVLDFFSYVQYARERLKEIVVEQSFIQKLSDEEKERLLMTIEESLYFQNVEAETNSLYMDVKRKITPLLRYIYFSDFFMRVDCEVDEELGIINKSIFKQMYIISEEENKKFKIPYYVRVPKAENIETKDVYEVEECIFNGKNITVNFWDKESEKIKEDEEKILNIRSEYEFILHKGRNQIFLKTKTRVPMEDTTYSHVITLPCLNYTVEYNVNTEGYHVLGYGFSLIELNGKVEDRTINKFRHGNSMRLTMNQWTLPGEGSVFILNNGSPRY